MEQMGIREVCAIVMSGSLGSEVEVTFTTQNGSAEGKPWWMVTVLRSIY